MHETEKERWERYIKAEREHVVVSPPEGMKYIQLDEIYSWTNECTQDKRFAEAQIPNALHEKLCDALAHYANVCRMIGEYLREHPEDRVEGE